MSAEIIRFPTRRRKAFRADWLEMKGLPHNCTRFKGGQMGLYYNLKERGASLRESLASLGPHDSDLLRETLTSMAACMDGQIMQHFGYTGDAA